MTLYRVFLPEARAMQGPLNRYGNYINNDIFKWLDDRYGPYPDDGPILDHSGNWPAEDLDAFLNCDAQWDAYNHRGKIVFFFKDPEPAMLFKLTWGGQDDS